MKFILIANTSKYLYHYRKLLILKLNQSFKDVILFCPEDRFSNELKKIAKFRNWDLSNSNEFNFFKLVYPLYKLYDFIKFKKPEIIHSHILKPNLYDGIKEIFIESRDHCIKEDDVNNTMPYFQSLLSQVPKWNQDIIKKWKRI